MNIRIHSPNPSKTISWASGTSTELFIFPSDGNFQKRTFDFRISTATVQVEETNFSDFSGLTRILLILNGNLSLNHEGKYFKELKTFDQDRFDGSWKTKSKGKVIDFNLMFNEKYDAKVNHLPFFSNDKTDLEITSELYYIFCRRFS
jgi:environmental stress-induced protein Ves